MSGTTRKRLWVRLAIFLVPAFTIVCVFGARQPELPGSLGVIATEVRVGMSQDEAAAVIRSAYFGRESRWDNPRIYANGRTHDGREFRSYFDWGFKEMPPADQIAWAELDVDDDRCRDLIITLGPGGVVSGIRLKSSSIWEEGRYALYSLLRVQ